MSIAGVFCLVFITVLAYISKDMYGVSNANFQTGEIVLTLAILLEWLGLGWYMWVNYPSGNALKK